MPSLEVPSSLSCGGSVVEYERITPDVLVEVHYDISEPTASRIYTNARSEALDEIIWGWVYDQMFRGKRDPEPDPPDLPVYVLRVGLQLNECDRYGHDSNFGNLSLAVGIAEQTRALLSRGLLTIQPLSQRPPCQMT